MLLPSEGRPSAHVFAGQTLQKDGWLPAAPATALVTFAGATVCEAAAAHIGSRTLLEFNLVRSTANVGAQRLWGRGGTAAAIAMWLLAHPSVRIRAKRKLWALLAMIPDNGAAAPRG